MDENVAKNMVVIGDSGFCTARLRIRFNLSELSLSASNVCHLFGYL